MDASSLGRRFLVGLGLWALPGEGRQKDAEVTGRSSFFPQTTNNNRKRSKKKQQQKKKRKRKRKKQKGKGKGAGTGEKAGAKEAI